MPREGTTMGNGVEGSSTDEVRSDDAASVGRRTFVRAATLTAVGATGLTATTGTAAAGDLVDGEGDIAEAPDDFPRVSTRDHFDDDADLINGESEWSYDVEGSWPGSWGEDTLTLFVHGWRNSDEDDQDIDGGYECQLALEENGYGGDTAVFTWDSDKGDSLDLGWADAKDIAERNGKKLANFTQWYTNEHGVDVRWIGHSLGARVIIFALESLDEDYDMEDVVTSVSLLGGAVEEDDVSLDAGWFDSEYGDHIEAAAEQFDNFYADDDEVLEYIYETREFEDSVGEKGCDGPQPSNYTDHDVNDIVPTHYDYYTTEEGCMDQVVDAW
jgi:pimeloyl-ACP methyl ester carboxylesterase